MVPIINAPKAERKVRLIAMQLKKNPKSKKSTFVATITSLKEDNGSKKYLPQCTKNVPRGKIVVMLKNSLRRLPPRKEVDREGELEEINK